MTRLTFSGLAYEPIEVELAGHVFETIDPPRSVSLKAAELQRQLAQVQEDGDPDEVVDLIAALLDLKLVSANGKRTKVSTLVKKEWKEGRVTMRQIGDFMYRLGEAEGRGEDSEDRPT